MKLPFRTAIPIILASLAFVARIFAAESAVDFEQAGVAMAAKGELNEAIAAFDRAIELDPKYAEAYFKRGEARFEGDTAGAEADFSRAIALNPEFGAAFLSRGLARNKLRNWAGAVADYERCFKTPNGGTDYPHLNLWLLRTRLGETGMADKELAAYRDTRLNVASSTWFVKVANYLLGNLTEADLFAAAASSPDEKTARGNRCEAWYYTGMKKLLAGDRKTAGEYFHKCMSTGVKDFVEYQYADSELKALEK